MTAIDRLVILRAEEQMAAPFPGRYIRQDGGAIGPRQSPRGHKYSPKERVACITCGVVRYSRGVAPQCQTCQMKARAVSKAAMGRIVTALMNLQGIGLQEAARRCGMSETSARVGIRLENLRRLTK